MQSSFLDVELNQWEMAMQLSELGEGQSATIEQIGGSGAFRRRVFELGILRGVRVYVEKYAPLKDPMEIIVKGNHISLRVDEAAKISVQLLNEG